MVTILFADLVGSTGLVEAHDPEAARELLDEVFRHLAACIRGFGGTIEKYVGDAVLAAFGYPRAHGHDAAQAVQAALALRELLASLDLPESVAPLRLRVGLDTGVVMATGSGDLRLAGGPLHTAARIQEVAAPDQVLASTRTLRAARDAVLAGPPWQVRLRGLRQPVEVAEVVGVNLAPDPPVLVGREEELRALLEALRAGEGHGPVTLLVGEAGVGKTTLTRVSAEQLASRPRTLWGRCLPDGQSLPLWPVREILATATGLAANDTLLRGAVDRLVATAWGERSSGAAAAAAAVRKLVGLGGAGEVGATAGELAAVLHAVLCRLARPEPLVIVIEDFHWAAPDLLEVLRVLATGRCPVDDSRLVLLAVGQPDLTPEQEAWASAVGARRVELGSLPPEPAAALLSSVMEQEVPPALRQQVLEASGGNPLFVRELGLALRERQELSDEAALPLTDSLANLIAARLDRLPVASKRLLCQAGVIGKGFSLGALARLAAHEPPVVDALLRELVALGIIEPEPVLAGDEPHYTFHHMLFRDVAYQLLPKMTRSDLHRRLATWLAEQPEERAALPEVIAHHFVRAVTLALEAHAAPTDADRALAAQAVAACRRAAERLREQEAPVAACSVLDEALSLTEVAGTAQEDVVELRALRGAMRSLTGKVRGAFEDLRAALGSRRAAIRAAASVELSDLHGRLGEYAEADAAAERALAEARSVGSPSLLARALHAKAQRPYLTGNLVEAERLLREAVRLAEQAGEAARFLDVRYNLLTIRLYLGTPLERLAAEARALREEADQAGRRLVTSYAHEVLGEVALLQGDLDAAERHFGTADHQRRDIGITFRRLWPLIGLTRVAIRRGQADQARRLAEEGVAVAAHPDGTTDPEALLNLAEAHLAAGDGEAAAAAVRRAWGGLDAGDVASRGSALRVEGRVAAAQGRLEDAIRLLRRSLESLEGSDYRLERLHTLVELTALLGRAGAGEEAARLAREAIGQAREIGAHALVRQLEERR